MKRRTGGRIITALIVIAVAAAVAYFWNAGAPIRPAAPAASGAFTVATTTVNASGTIAGQNYVVLAHYPNVSGPANAPAFNAAALAAVQSQIADFKSAIAQSSVSNLPAEIKSLANTLNIDYSIDGTSTDYASAVLGSETYLIGMAHPSHLLFSLAFDLKNGQPIDLASLFKPGADYLQTLSALTTAALLSQIQSGAYGSTPEFLQQSGGASASADNFRVFGLSPQGLVIHFQDYQVGPYAAGQAQVVIPYAQLKDIAAPGGFLAQ